MDKVRLPVVQGAPGTTPSDEMRSSLSSDGRRAVPHPADVRGRFIRARRLVFGVLIALWAVVPFVRVGGRPFLMLDVAQRRFFLFGGSYGAQDAWRLWFLLTGLGLALLITTSLFGRVWCGWTCPQTVFLESIFRPIERVLEGPREERLKRHRGQLGVAGVLRKGVKHLLYLGMATFVAHIFVGYFVSPYRLWELVLAGPRAHPEVFVWAVALTGVFYLDFARFREQLCLGVCPYGRLQAVLVDPDTLVVGYAPLRGEPRAKPSEKAKHGELGDCVDCKRCVVVCPTGIDIRNGLQLDCIGCAQCIDACDEVMDKLGRSRGLVRYDTGRALAGGPRTILRPRAWLYLGVAAAWVLTAFFVLRGRVEFEATLARVGAAPFVVDGEDVRNAFNVHLVNKGADRQYVEVEARGLGSSDVRFDLPVRKVDLQGYGSATLPVVASVPRSQAGQPIPFRVEVRSREGQARELRGTLLGPVGGARQP